MEVAHLKNFSGPFAHDMLITNFLSPIYMVIGPGESFFSVSLSLRQQHCPVFRTDLYFTCKKQSDKVFVSYSYENKVDKKLNSMECVINVSK